MAQSYRDLVAWNKVMELVTQIYRVTIVFAKSSFFLSPLPPTGGEG
jgi:hypothetical protein